MNKADDARIAELWRDGSSATMIAAVIRSTKGKVSQRLRRLGLNATNGGQLKAIKDAGGLKAVARAKALGRRLHHMSELPKVLPLSAIAADPVQRPLPPGRPSLSIPASRTVQPAKPVSDELAGTKQPHDGTKADAVGKGPSCRPGDSERISAERPPERITKPVTIHGLTNYTCRYPLWADNERPITANAFYCGEVSANYETGTPYCPFHTKLTGAAPRQRPEYLRRVNVTAIGQGVR